MASLDVRLSALSFTDTQTVKRIQRSSRRNRLSKLPLRTSIYILSLVSMDGYK